MCTGNICRSPTAERIANAYAHRIGLVDFKAMSAGLRAVVGNPIHPSAARVLEGLGGEASNFAAQRLTPRLVGSADLILTMTVDQRDLVLERTPKVMRRTYALSEFAQLVVNGDVQGLDDLPGLRSRVSADRLVDIADPIGRDPDFFETIGHQIADLVRPVVDMCQTWQMRA